MLRRHIDFIAVLFIAVVMIAVSKASSVAVAPVEVYSIRFDNAVNMHQREFTSDFLTCLASLLNQ